MQYSVWQALQFPLLYNTITLDHTFYIPPSFSLTYTLVKKVSLQLTPVFEDCFVVVSNTFEPQYCWTFAETHECLSNYDTFHQVFRSHARGRMLSLQHLSCLHVEDCFVVVSNASPPLNHSIAEFMYKLERTCTHINAWWIYEVLILFQTKKILFLFKVGSHALWRLILWRTYVSLNGSSAIWHFDWCIRNMQKNNLCIPHGTAV